MILLVFIRLRRPYPAGCAIPEATLQKMRAEFEFWYPFDLRVSGGSEQLSGMLAQGCDPEAGLSSSASVWSGF
jgi:hypothetical protein